MTFDGLTRRNLLCGAAAFVRSPRGTGRLFPEEQKYLVAEEKAGAPDHKGWYHHSAGVVDTGRGLVCTYRRTDSHTGVISDIMAAHSIDGGRSWGGHRVIARSDVWNHKGVWVAPQLSRLRDGRLVVLADFGSRRSGENWPMLAQWQQPPRGMSNHLFWSRDGGRTWDGPHKIDDVGGEPGYIVELSDGALLYPRTESRQTDALWDPPMPWGRNYYRNVIVFSDDGGKTWGRTAVLSDDPHQGDCEAGIVELESKRLLAVTRIGFGGGRFAQPSRFLYSRDGGRSWPDVRLSPIYAQRAIVRRLQSRNLLVTFRNSWGTPGTYALEFSPSETLPYQPASFLWDESRCTISGGTMRTRTDEGAAAGASFALYPAQAPDSVVEIEADLRVESAGPNGCNISAGCFVRFEAQRVCLADRPDDGFPLDAAQWRHYRILRERGTVSIFVDGDLKLSRPTRDLETRMVCFGNRGREQNASVSEWKSLSVMVRNARDHSIHWKWSAREGFPDQFRRDRVVCLDRNGSMSAGDSGYSGWCQTADGSIVIVDYTRGNPPAAMPFVRAYVAKEADFL